MKAPLVAGIVVAAGSGSRLGSSLPKALVELVGKPLVAHAVAALQAGGVELVVVAAPAAHLDAVRKAVGPGTVVGLGTAVEPGTAGGRGVVVVPGGPSRQASVAAALAALPPSVEVVLVHDAARCFAPSALVERVVAAVRAGHRAVVPVVPVTDTLVVASGDGPVSAYEDRARFRVVQTPQGFDRETLERAHAAARDRAQDESAAATDDASLAVAIGETVWAVAGDDAAMKITTPRDLALAEHGLAAATRMPGPAAPPNTHGPAAPPNTHGPARETEQDARGPVSP